LHIQWSRRPCYVAIFLGGFIASCAFQQFLSVIKWLFYLLLAVFVCCELFDKLSLLDKRFGWNLQNEVADIAAVVYSVLSKAIHTAFAK